MVEILLHLDAADPGPAVARPAGYQIRLAYDKNQRPSALDRRFCKPFPDPQQVSRYFAGSNKAATAPAGSWMTATRPWPPIGRGPARTLPPKATHCSALFSTFA